GRLKETIASEFGAPNGVPERAWPHLATSILAKLGTQDNLVVSSTGSELLFRNFPGAFRAHLVATESRRIGNLMVDRRLERQDAKDLLKQIESDESLVRKRRFGSSKTRLEDYDLVMNADSLSTEQISDVLEVAVRTKGLLEQGLLTLSAEAQ